MIAVTFGDCLGWLHEGRGATGVVMCGTFGQEAMIAYRGWVELAAALAESGLNVLRFDYPGTGDSLGVETDADLPDAWLESIRQAVACLRTLTRSDKVILVGVRLGGALALIASADLPHVQAVVCLVTVVSGKTYLRELRLLTNGWRDANLLPPALEREGCLEIVGDRLSAGTQEYLLRLDLRTIPSAAADVLLMDDDAYPDTTELAEHLAGLGCRVSRLAFTGATSYLQDSLASRVPHEAFARLIDWCSQFAASELGSSVACSPAGQALLRSASFDEMPLLFGSSRGLVGILCSPHTASDAAPTVIMVNTGFGRRIGDGRVYVTLARHLAAIGIPSLRMDLSGFGDSVGETGADPDPYSLRHVDDVVFAIDALEQVGLRRPLLIGICSGAHTVFHSALADRRVRGIAAVNLQKFVWKAGSSLKVENRRQRRPSGFYFKAAGAWTAWRRVLSGDVAILPILAVLIVRPFNLVFRELGLRIETVTGIGSRFGMAARDVKRLSSYGTRVDLVYSEGDPGLSELSRHFGTRLRRLTRIPDVHLHMVDAADHALLDYAARSQFVAMMVDELRGASVPGLKPLPATAAPVRLASVPAA